MRPASLKYQKRPDNLANSSSDSKTQNVYMQSLLTTKVTLKITEIGGNLKDTLEKQIVKNVEGRCINEGYIRPNSVKILEYSSGNIVGEHVDFIVSYECMVCHPVENMKIQCTVHRVTQAGIHAQVIMDGVVPLTIFVARDHNYMITLFSQIKENQEITVRIEGIQYSLNDPCITAIATLVDVEKERRQKEKNKNKVKIRMGDEDEEEDIEAEDFEE